MLGILNNIIILNNVFNESGLDIQYILNILWSSCLTFWRHWPNFWVPICLVSFILFFDIRHWYFALAIAIVECNTCRSTSILILSWWPHSTHIKVFLIRLHGGNILPLPLITFLDWWNVLRLVLRDYVCRLVIIVTKLRFFLFRINFIRAISLLILGLVCDLVNIIWILIASILASLAIEVTQWVDLCILSFQLIF